MVRHRFKIVQAPTGDLYSRLLRAGLVYCSTLGVIGLRPGEFSGSAATVLGQLTDFLVEKRKVGAWPDETMVYANEDLYLVDYVKATAEIMEKAANGLFDWQRPELPENPHLLRADGSVWLGTSTHEFLAWLDLTPPELADLEAHDATIASALRSAESLDALVLSLVNVDIASSASFRLADGASSFECQVIEVKPGDGHGQLEQLVTVLSEPDLYGEPDRGFVMTGERGMLRQLARGERVQAQMSAARHPRDPEERSISEVVPVELLLM